MPEVFVAKGRDGKTDIWGIICRPRNLDPSRKYPVIENIYAGPQDSYVPKAFSPYHAMQSLAELGFIVVRIDFACVELANSDAPLVDIALAAGFCDQSHFTRTFRRYTGMVPSLFRGSVR
jgi:hypothetical protein